MGRNRNQIAPTPTGRRDRIASQKRAGPTRVAILGLGPSLRSYTRNIGHLGSRKKLADETWGINAVLDMIQCDRGFHMDDVRIQELRAEADPNGNIAAMLPWLRTHPGPIYTSRPHPDYPGLVAYPLADVLNACDGQRYFNSTAAYAVAFAIHLGVREIQLYGFDFTYPNSHKAEKGRACVEFWLGFARARGIDLQFPADTIMLDACEPGRARFYGYDTVDLLISGEAGKERVKLKPRDDIPTADEIEARYDHSQHPSPLVTRQGHGG